MGGFAVKSELTPVFARPVESAPRDPSSLSYEQTLREIACNEVHYEAMPSSTLEAL